MSLIISRAFDVSDQSTSSHLVQLRSKTTTASNSVPATDSLVSAPAALFSGSNTSCRYGPRRSGSFHTAKASGRDFSVQTARSVNNQFVLHDSHYALASYKFQGKNEKATVDRWESVCVRPLSLGTEWVGIIHHLRLELKLFSKSNSVCCDLAWRTEKTRSPKTLSTS